MWPIGSSRWSQNSYSEAFGSFLSWKKKLSIGVLMKKGKEKKEEKKDNQYKLNKAMAIAIGLMLLLNSTSFKRIRSKKQIGKEECMNIVK